MQVTLIGSGNVATVLGRRIIHSGHIIRQVFSKNPVHARELANELSAAAISDGQNIDRNADIYIVAISDTALNSVHEWLQLGDRFVVHTAGSVPMNTLEKISNTYGVLYPLQSLRKEILSPEIPILVDANNPWNKTRITAFAQSFADSVKIAGDKERSALHLAAVISNNFSNHLFAITEAYCEKEGVDFKMLLPLLNETVKRLSSYSPASLQTGPAIRKDDYTLQKHKEKLKDHQHLLDMYNVFTESISKY